MSDPQTADPWRRLLDRLAILVIVIAGSATAYRQLTAPSDRATVEGTRQPEPPPEPPVPTAPISTKGLWTKGSRAASLGLLVFADFECRACRVFARNVLPEVERDLVDGGLLRLFFSHYPLETHTRAVSYAIAAECAGQHGKFWQMHDALFAKPQPIDEENLLRTARTLGITGFATCSQDRGIAASVRSAFESAAQFGIRGTPTVFLGRLTSDERLMVTDRWTGVKSPGSIAREARKLVGSPQ